MYVCVCVSIKGMGQGRLTSNINGRGVNWHPYTSALCVPAWQTFLSPCVSEGVFDKGRLLNSCWASVRAAYFLKLHKKFVGVFLKVL